jgi:DNA-directed RNA polymerase specialized sigma24 family protein
MNSLSPTAVHDEKTVSPPRPARTNGVSSPCVSSNDQKYPIKVALVETRTSRDFLSSRTKETTEAAPTASSLLSASDECAGCAIQHQSSSAEQEHDPLTDVPAVRKALLRMVIALEVNFHTRQDLLQEAVVYFLSREQQYPGQRRSWYLQGVKFHLNDLRNSGRSLDSLKRRGAQAALADNRDGRDQWRDSLELDEGIMSAVNAHDICCLLLDRLKPIDRTILSALVDGLGDQDIAEELHVSQMFVIRHRRGIAELAIKLGINPAAASPLHRATSKKSKPVEA